MSNVPITWKGELRLAFVDMDRITFHRHPDEPEMNMQHGRRYACVFVEIADDEKATRPERTARVDKQRHPSNVAAILCLDPDFQRWALEQMEGASALLATGESAEAVAARFMKTICGIDSRAELDTNPDALLAFQTRVEIPYYRERHAK